MIRAVGLTRIYRLGGQEIRAVDGVDLTVREGEYLRVVGASGSGKSTLLCLLAGLDSPTAGRIETPLGDLAELSRRDLALWRAEHVGMVFQAFNLIPHRTAIQNVELGMLFYHVPREERTRRARAALEQLGLGDRMHHRPSSLSGGEQQRVALARALVKRPHILFADEPTGNLDQENAGQLANALKERNKSGITVVLVTHDPALAAEDAHRTIRMHYGRIIEEASAHTTIRAGAPDSRGGAMIAREFFSFAAGNLWRMKLRAGLTISGIVIGIGALVAMLSFANGVQRNVSGEFRKLGLFRTMQVFSGAVPAIGGRRATQAPDTTKGPPLDAEALEKIAAVDGVALVYPQLAFDARIEGLGSPANARVQGLPASFVKQRSFGEIQGRFFESDTAHEAVVRRVWLTRQKLQPDSVLGRTLTVRATGSSEIFILLASRELERIGIPERIITPLGDVAKLILPILRGSPNRSFQVVGITDFESGFGFDMGSVLVPIGAAERIDAISFSDPMELLTLLSEPARGEWPLLVVTVTEERVYARVRAAIEAMGFHVFSFLDQFEEMRKSFLIFDAIVGAIGFLAIFIASLSIVNTMVMSIIERTREIGILKSLGAEEGQIRLLFLVESGLIGLLGSLGGLVLGYGVSRVGSYILRRIMAAQQIPPVDLFCLSVWIALGAVAFGVAVSLAAGLYPAARAARIDPVEALRQE